MPAKLSPRPTGTVKGVPAAQRLTAQQELFVDALFSRNFHLKDAAIAAGVAEKNASRQACFWMGYPQVQALIAKKREFVRNTSEVDVKRIVQELARIAFFNPKSLLKPDGKPYALPEMPDDIAAALGNINVSYGEEQDGDGNFHVLRNIRYSPHDKLSALKQLSTILGVDNGEGMKIINNNTLNQIIVKWEDLYRKEAISLPEAALADPVEARIKAEGGAVFGETSNADAASAEGDAASTDLNVVDSNT